MTLLATSPVDHRIPPPAPERPPRSGAVRRAQRVTVCLGFLALMLSQQPGKLVPDTKLDLAVDPLGFLGRALRLWEPDGFAGQVQNQAYGYLFPMGPFFAAGHLAGIPPWIVQRLWVATVLSVAFLGVLALADRLRIGTPTTRFVAALAYALAPRMIGAVGTISIEVLPMALAPWVLVPLVAGARGGSPRRAAALSGVAVFCVGGVNAAATAAVLPLPALWLLTRSSGPRRRRLMAWWAGAVALATAWWAVPLLLLGRYSPPFLDWIESAATTTAPGELTEALRGTTQWLPRLATPAGPVSPAGWSLVHDVLPVTATVLLAAAGLAALARRDLPERTWLGLAALTGLALLTAAHVGPVQGLFAGPLHAALDGALAPLRNVHKFDPVLRLPVVLGLAHVLAVAGRWRPRSGLSRPVRHWAPAAACVAVLVTATPAVTGSLHPPTAFSGMPGYWEETAAFLAAERPAGRALLVPASTFGTYIWGSPADEPLQPLADSPWEVRNAVPLTPAGHIRMLDAVEARLATGRGSAGLAPFLARAGISHLVLRHDLDHGSANATRPALVLAALLDSPGIRRVATFGPLLNTSTALPGVVLDSALTSPRPAVEVFAVADPAPRAYTVRLADAAVVQGGPEELLAAADRGLLAGRPALLPEGEAAAGDPVDTVVGDALVRREHAFGAIADSVSAGLTADEDGRLPGPARDYLLPDQAAHESVVEIGGGGVSASSSASDAGTLGGTRPDRQPYAAVDGDPATAWRPAGTFAPVEQWWRVDLPRSVNATVVQVTLDPELAAVAPSRVRVRTDAGELTADLDRTTAPQELPLPFGPTRSLVLSADPPADGSPGPLIGLAEVTLPGVVLERSVVLPDPVGPVSAFTFTATWPAAAGCAALGGSDPVDGGGVPVRCTPELVRAAEEPNGLHRRFEVLDPADYDLDATAVPRPGAELDALLADVARRSGEDVLTATATSQAVPDPRGGPAAAVDGDPATAWTAGPDDPAPELEVRWAEERTVDRVRVEYAPGTPAARPIAVTVRAGGEERSAFLEPDGTAVFAPIDTDHLTLSFPLQDPLSSYDPYRRGSTPLAVGVSEVTVPGTVPVRPGTPVELRCGEAPPVTVDGVRRTTAARSTVAGMRSLDPVALEICDDAPVRLAAGMHRLGAASTGTFTPASATLVRAGEPRPEPARAVPDTPVWDAEHRVVQLAARSVPTLLVVPENRNEGWVATLGRAQLHARTVDGWQQAWVVPPGPATTVTLDFTPGGPYRVALAAGLLAVLVLIGLALVPGCVPTPPRQAGPFPLRTPAGPVRRPAAEPARTGPRTGGLVVSGAAVGAVAVSGAGAVGVGALAVALAARRFRPRGRGLPARATVPVLVAVAVLLAGLTLAGGADLVVARQLLAACAVALLALTLVGRARRESRTRSFPHPSTPEDRMPEPDGTGR